MATWKRAIKSSTKKSITAISYIDRTYLELVVYHCITPKRGKFFQAAITIKEKALWRGKIVIGAGAKQYEAALRDGERMFQQIKNI